MKKLLFVIWFGIVFFVSSAPSYAGFLIQLKNGRTIYTEDYRIEGDQILLFLESGVVNISKGEVQSILQDTREIEEGKKAPPEKLEEKITQEGRVSGKADIEYYKKKKREIQGRLDEAKKIYFDAANKSEKDEARKIMLSISNELFNLQDEVRKNNNGIIPNWWKEE